MELFGGIFWEKFFGRIFCEGFFGEDYWKVFFVYIGIDLFFKILFFVKILSQDKARRKARKIPILRSARASSIALKNCQFVKNTIFDSFF